MLAKRIIPCLDIAEGRVVKGVHFVNLRDAGDPVEQAALYNQAGADELVFLDISASPEGRSTVVDIVRRVADTVFMPLTVGGGIRTVEGIRSLLLSGAEHGGSHFSVLAVGVRRIPGTNQPVRWEVFINGGRTPTGLDAIEWVQQ